LAGGEIYTDIGMDFGWGRNLYRYRQRFWLGPKFIPISAEVLIGTEIYTDIGTDFPAQGG
jgi:hypothetical protein